MIKTLLDIFRNDMILVDRNNGGMDFEKHVELKNGTLHSIVLEEVAAWEENYLNLRTSNCAVFLIVNSLHN